MQPFAQIFPAWQPFFTTLASVCATLAGLLFVAISLHTGTRKDESKANLLRLAQHTFGDFIQVLFIGVFCSIPAPVPGFVAIAIILIVVLGAREIVQRFVEAWRDRQHTQHRGHIIRRLGLSMLGRTLLLAGGICLFFLHDTREDMWNDMMYIFSGSLVLLMAGLRNAWYLLLQELA